MPSPTPCPPSQMAGTAQHIPLVESTPLPPPPSFWSPLRLGLMGCPLQRPRCEAKKGGANCRGILDLQHLQTGLNLGRKARIARGGGALPPPLRPLLTQIQATTVAGPGPATAVVFSRPSFLLRVTKKREPCRLAPITIHPKLVHKKQMKCQKRCHTSIQGNRKVWVNRHRSSYLLLGEAAALATTIGTHHPCWVLVPDGGAQVWAGCITSRQAKRCGPPRRALPLRV